MNHPEQSFPFGDMSDVAYRNFVSPSGVEVSIATRLGQTLAGEQYALMCGALKQLERGIQTNPLSPSHALGGRVAPPANALTLPVARQLGLDTYYRAKIAHVPALPVLDTVKFNDRLTVLRGMPLTPLTQQTIPLMKWSKHEQSRYFRLVEAAGREYSKPVCAALFLGAYLGMWVERGTEGIDASLYAHEQLPFMRRHRPHTVL